MTALTIGIIIGVVGIIVTILVVAIPFVCKKFRAPVIISPKRISLKAQPWNIKTTFHVQNRTEEVLFDIWVKLYGENCDLRTGDIKINPKDGKPFSSANLSAKISNISISYDFIRMDGVDSIGNKCIFFVIYSLDPHTTQTFTIDITVATNEYTKKSRILLRVARHAKTPAQVLSRKNEAAFPFPPPENFTAKSIALLMKRE